PQPSPMRVQTFATSWHSRSASRVPCGGPHLPVSGCPLVVDETAKAAPFFHSSCLSGAGRRTLHRRRYLPAGVRPVTGWKGEEHHRGYPGRPVSGRPGHRHQTRSNRSRFITLFQAATKSRTNFSFASSHPYTSESARSWAFEPKTRSTAVAVHLTSL